MKPKLSAEQKEAFGQISYVIGDDRPHALEDIMGAAVPKDKRKECMSLFVEMGLYAFDGKFYTITKRGKDEFKKIRDSFERVAPGRLIY